MNTETIKGDVMNKSNQLQEEINDRIHKINCLDNNLQRLEKEIKEEKFKLKSDEYKLKILNHKEKRKIVQNHGQGSMKIELKNNKIFVYHGTDNTLLYQRDSTSETWDLIWEIIRGER